MRAMRTAVLHITLFTPDGKRQDFERVQGEGAVGSRNIYETKYRSLKLQKCKAYS